MKKLYDKYKKLQDKLKNLIIRAKEGQYQTDDNGMVEGAVVIDLTGEMKLKSISINDESLLSPASKEVLEDTIKKCFEKAQTKAQEVIAEKTKEILGFDPSQMANMMGGGGLPGLS